MNSRKVKLFNGKNLTLLASFKTYEMYKTAYGICLDDARNELDIYITTELFLVQQLANKNEDTSLTAKQISQNVKDYKKQICELSKEYENRVDMTRIAVAMILAGGSKDTVDEIETDIVFDMNCDSALSKAVLELNPLLNAYSKKKSH